MNEQKKEMWSIETSEIDPNSHAAIHGVTCRRCDLPWPCADPLSSEKWDAGHTPDLIPNGAVVTTMDALERLIMWAPAARCPVVLDNFGVSWILFDDEDVRLYAGTIECPDDGTPGRFDLEDLPAERGPLRVLFNGDSQLLPQNEVSRMTREVNR